MERCRTLKKLDLSWCGCDGELSEEVFVQLRLLTRFNDRFFLIDLILF